MQKLSHQDHLWHPVWHFTLHALLACSVLLLVRVGIAAISGSLSIIVTTLDAVLDVISGFIIWFTALSIRNVNKYKYPIGKVN